MRTPILLLLLALVAVSLRLESPPREVLAASPNDADGAVASPGPDAAEAVARLSTPPVRSVVRPARTEPAGRSAPTAEATLRVVHPHWRAGERLWLQATRGDDVLLRREVVSDEERHGLSTAGHLVVELRDVLGGLRAREEVELVAGEEVMVVLPWPTAPADGGMGTLHGTLELPDLLVEAGRLETLRLELVPRLDSEAQVLAGSEVVRQAVRHMPEAAPSVRAWSFEGVPVGGYTLRVQPLGRRMELVVAPGANDPIALDAGPVGRALLSFSGPAGSPFVPQQVHVRQRHEGVETGRVRARFREEWAAFEILVPVGPVDVELEDPALITRRFTLDVVEGWSDHRVDLTQGGGALVPLQGDSWPSGLDAFDARSLSGDVGRIQLTRTTDWTASGDRREALVVESERPGVVRLGCTVAGRRHERTVELAAWDGEQVQTLATWEADASAHDARSRPTDVRSDLPGAFPERTVREDPDDTEKP